MSARHKVVFASEEKAAEAIGMSTKMIHTLLGARLPDGTTVATRTDAGKILIRESVVVVLRDHPERLLGRLKRDKMGGLKAKLHEGRKQQRDFLNLIEARSKRPLLEEARQERQQSRASRIAERRAARIEQVPSSPRCASCHKKEARLDGLCKRCAKAAGIMPTGKIGES